MGETVLDVLDRFFGFGFTEAETDMDPGPEGAVLRQGHACPEFGKTHEDERQKRFTIPLVVGQNVKMLEDVLMEQMGFIEQKHGMRAFSAELLDVGADGIEDRGGGGLWRKSEGEAELVINVN